MNRHDSSNLIDVKQNENLLIIINDFNLISGKLDIRKISRKLYEIAQLAYSG